MSNCGYCDLYGPPRCPTHRPMRSLLSSSRHPQHRCRVERLPRTALIAPWVVLCGRCAYVSSHYTHRLAFGVALAHASRIREVVL